MHKITPSLWFDMNAEEAVNFYLSVFRDSKILSLNRYPENIPGVGGKVMTISFILNGQEFVALNGGPHYSFTPAVSFVVNCGSQEEVDYYWEKLLEGGAAEQCGWLRDKFGLSWQIVPAELIQMLGSDNREGAQRVSAALLKMIKLDLNVLRDAFGGARG